MIKALIVLNGPYGSMEFEVGKAAASHPERAEVTSIEADTDNGHHIINFGTKEHWEVITPHYILKVNNL
jgi:hypothetical protein